MPWRLLLAATLVAACGGPTTTPTPSAPPSPVATPAPSVSPTPVPTPTPVPSAAPPATPEGEAPDVLAVTCTPTGTEAASSRVAVQPDGVHILIRNASGGAPLFEIDDVGGSGAPDDAEERVWELPVGVARIRCEPDTAQSEVPWITVQVVDPNGFYVPDRPDCAAVSAATLDYAAGARGPAGDPVDVARDQITGLRAGDEVGPAGYVARDSKKVRVVRDGTVIAVGNYHPDGAGGWLLGEIETCSDAGLAWEP